MILHEFVIGQQSNSEISEVEDLSIVKNVYILTESVKEVAICGHRIGTKFLTDNLDDHEALTKISFDNEEVDLHVRNVSKRREGASLELGDTPFLDRITLQQTRYVEEINPKKYSRRISYLRLEKGGRSVEIGREKQLSESNPALYKILPVEKVTGPCMISGVGMDNNDICSLQIISAVESVSGEVLSCESIPPYLYSYGKSDIGLIRLDRDDKVNRDFGIMGFEQAIGFNILDVARRQYQYMANRYADRTALQQLYPDYYEMIDRAVYDNIEDIIYSVLRLERHLRWRVFHDIKGESYVDSDPFLRLKLYKTVQSLSSTVERCKLIRDNRPSMNCYAIAYLGEFPSSVLPFFFEISKNCLPYFLVLMKEGNRLNNLTASIVFLCQLGLMFILFMSVIEEEYSKDSFVLTESIFITPVITLFSIVLVWKQSSNTFTLFKAYPGMKTTLMGIFEVVGNIMIGVAVLIIQFIIVMKQDTRLDYVLNSVATIFILELDDQAVFEDLDSIAVLNRKFLTKRFLKNIEGLGKTGCFSFGTCDACMPLTDGDKLFLFNTDDNLFKHNNWFSARNEFKINIEDCILIEETFSSTVTIVTDDPQDEKFTLEKKEWSNHHSSYDWIEIVSGRVMKDIKLTERSRATFSFRWRDQGWGNQRGKLRIRLLGDNDTIDAEEIASSPIYGEAPHTYEELEIYTFQSNHGLVRKCKVGRTYVIEAMVGGGGGHELYVKDMCLSITSYLIELGGAVRVNSYP